MTNDSGRLRSVWHSPVKQRLYEHERLLKAKRDAGPELYKALERLIGAMPVVVAYGEHAIADCDCPFCEADVVLAKVRADPPNVSGLSHTGVDRG